MNRNEWHYIAVGRLKPASLLYYTGASYMKIAPDSRQINYANSEDYSLVLNPRTGEQMWLHNSTAVSAHIGAGEWQYIIQHKEPRNEQ